MNALSVLNQKINMPDGHFRSKFFIASNSLNVYVAAAGPIFSILERLSTAVQVESFEVIYDALAHEIKSFLSQIRAEEDSPEQQAIAYFLLCATTDEVLGKAAIKSKLNKKSFKAFTQTSKNKIEPQKKFFEIQFEKHSFLENDQ
jgi:type VI protein secretion system component VasF